MAKGKGSGGHARSAITGRYISKAAAARHPRTSVVESSGNNSTIKAHRSAVTGRYVTSRQAQNSPKTTVTENG